jgi:MYXO-CTERM domain-containing protein
MKKHMKLVAIAGSALIALSGGAAFAHIELLSPSPRTLSQKVGPCGALNSTRGTNVTVYAPGATIEVKWKETINHPGHYRISFDPTGQDFSVPLSFNDLTQTKNVVLDNIADKPDPMYSHMITLPTTPCENCTLQVFQMMTDKPPYSVPGNDIYFQCADIAIRGPAVPMPDAAPSPTGDSDAGAPTAGTGSTGGCQSTGDTGWLLGLLGLAFVMRRKHATIAD